MAAQHFLGLTGAKTINTACFRAAQDAIRAVTERNAMGAIYGNAGCGKTFAVSFACRHAQRDTCVLDFPARVTMKQVVRTMLGSITGVRHDGDRFRLTEDLIDVLAERERLVIVDEAQRLGHEAIEFLRHLHDHSSTTFALVLVGGNGCWRVIERYPMLRSRIYRPVEFTALSEDEVLEIIPRFHPLFAKAEPEAIALLDDEFARGNFRNWAAATLASQEICAAADLSTVTVDAAQRALALLSSP